MATADQPPVCPICGGAGRSALNARDRNRAVTSERFVYHRCVNCGTLFLANIPRDLERYYQGGYYPFGPDGEPLWQGNPLRLAAESFRVDLIGAHVDGGRLIDIGAGAGGFALAARAAGFDVTALEMDGQCCAYMQRELGVTAIQTDEPAKTLSTLEGAQAITLWHVLEHLADPLGMLETVIEKLDEGGVLAIAVPNVRSLQFRLLRTRWAHLDAPRHLVLTGADTLTEKICSLGMSRVAVTTSDPDGQECDLFGWLNALRRRPANGPQSPRVQMAAFGLRRLMAPVERRGLRGSAITMLFRKDERAG